ncbi:hypothetical protein DRQ25_14030 [Candidatus Fermentibacteria bacterium]|nr:MAG: hypothetical protein DRQ25_14030 [Candidatus Fermentibacteria bacterium]
MANTIIDEPLLFTTVKGKYMWILKKLDDAEKEKPSRALRWKEIKKGAVMPDSTFSMIIRRLETHRFIKKIICNGKEGYMLDRWGALLVQGYSPTILNFMRSGRERGLI